MNNAPLKRRTQLALWILLMPALGALQAISSFAPVILSAGHLRSPDLSKLFLGLTFVYGTGWFLPALLISDLAMLRRPLRRHEFLRYISFIAVTAVLVGLFLPGMMVMLAYPTTACAILVFGYLHRQRRSASAPDSFPSSARSA